MAAANSKSMSISYGVEAKYKFPSAGAGIEFDPSTKCQFIDVVQYSAPSDTRRVVNEGFLDDASLNSWLNEVCYNTPPTLVKQTLISRIGPPAISAQDCRSG
jgi:hypothetical protein